ncbi:hypothetical protein WJW27_004874 [Escherichia coli]|nr:hypothetical protein vBEcoMphAPEC6_00565 [Escherichia phage ph0011]
MSLRSALKEAKKIHNYMIMVQEGSVPGVYKTSDTEFFVKDRDDYDESEICAETLVLHIDTDDTDDCEYQMHNQYLSYYRDEDIIIYTPDYDDDNIIIPYSVLEGPWDSEEYYFQQSTVYNEDVLDVIVIMWYFKSIDSDSFYFDYEYVENTVGGR